MKSALPALLMAFLLTCTLHAAEKKAEGVLLFNSKDLATFKIRDEKAGNHWKAVAGVSLDPTSPKKLVAIGTGPKSVLLNSNVGSDLITKETFGDCIFTGEFLVAKDSNSGIFFQGQYELQVYDSHGIPYDKVGEGDCGGIPWTSKPRVNAARPAGEWQTYEVEFRAPRFDAAGKKIENAKFVRVVLNGQKVQENLELKEPTGAELDGGERAKGPFVIQGNEGVVAYRNLRVMAK
jgi:hypothetical protein